jgi:phosphate transport system protein
MQQHADHIVQGYDEDLNTLTNALSQMGGQVESMIVDAVRAIKKRDSNLAKEVIERDAIVNALQEQIDADALRMLALRHPMAADLRRVVGAIRAANDLERIGDLAEGIARRAMTINQSEKLGLSSGVARMGKLVKAQLKSALDALLNEDADQAVDVWLQDQDVDALYASLFRELLTYMMEDHRNIQACTGLLFVAKNLERVGDHATNIAEIVYFSVHGRSLVPEALQQADADS